MAATEQTPTELGIPLPLVPIEDLAEAQRLDQVNLHHAFHPRRDPLLAEEGGLIVRTSRLQWAYRDGNHLDYHHHFTGPALPTTVEERFRVAVLARAGFVPEHALQMRGDKQPEEVVLSWAQRRMLRYGQLYDGSIGDSQKFLGKFVIAQDLSDLGESIVDEFLHTADRERRLSLGGVLLGEAILRAVEPVAQDYRQAWTDQRIPRIHPARPQRFIKKTLNVPKHGPKLVRQLQDHLAEAA